MPFVPTPSPFPFQEKLLDAVTEELNEKLPRPVNHHLDKKLQKYHALMMAAPVLRLKTTSPAREQVPYAVLREVS